MLREVGTIIEVAHNPDLGFVKTTTLVRILDENDEEKGRRIDEKVEDGASPKGMEQLASHDASLTKDKAAVSEKLGITVAVGSSVAVATARNAERARLEQERLDAIAAAEAAAETPNP